MFKIPPTRSVVVLFKNQIDDILDANGFCHLACEHDQENASLVGMIGNGMDGNLYWDRPVAHTIHADERFRAIVRIPLTQKQLKERREGRRDKRVYDFVFKKKQLKEIQECLRTQDIVYYYDMPPQQVAREPAGDYRGEVVR